MREETKTLKIFVFDTVKVSDDYGKKPVVEYSIERPVFVAMISLALEQLFSNVNNFCRPPTKVNFSLSVPAQGHVAF